MSSTITKIYSKILSKTPRPSPKLRGKNDSSSNNSASLMILEGASARIYEVDKFGDDKKLEYEEDGSSQECKITSKPIIVDDEEWYFTRDGFKGTMALNDDTLLSADVYQPSEKGSDDADDGWSGDIEELKGSKATLKESNRGIRMRKLLKPEGMDKQTLLLAMGTGAFVGFMISKQMGA